MPNPTEIVYMHDGGPFPANLKLERLEKGGKYYRLLLSFTDSTDYERVQWMIGEMVKKNTVAILY